MRTSLVCLVAGLAVSASAMAGEIDAKYQGEWVRGTLKAGETNPVEAGCLRTKLGSMLGAMTITEAGGTFFSENYFDNEECQGDNVVKSAYTYTFKNQSKDDSHQIVTIPTQYYEVIVSGAAVVAKLNEKKVCGFEGWEAKTYTSNTSPLKDCTWDNMGLTIPPFISNEDLQNWRTRFRVQGTGVEVASSHKPDGDFSHSSVYIRKP